MAILTTDFPSSLVDPSVCGGRLTLTSGTAVTTSDVTAAGTLYFTPFNGGRVALYDGRWMYREFAEISLSLTLTDATNYDAFVYDNAGTLALELSDAWTNATTRDDALTTQNGVYVKSGATTRRYVGTIRASAANQTEDSVSKRFVWNNYNRRPRQLVRAETGANWTYNSTTFRQANASSANAVYAVQGLAEDVVRLESFNNGTSPGGTTGVVGIGIDSTTVNSASTYSGVSVVVANSESRCCAIYNAVPSLGYHAYNWLEANGVGAGTVTWAGAASGAVSGGIQGEVWG
jgi:hypothetical protein